MPLEFNPNNPAKQKNRPVWATYLPARRGAAFKQHTDRGKALNALSYQGSGILYHWEPVTDDEGVAEPQWVEVARTDGPDPRHCERCGGDFEYESKWGNKYTARYGLWIGKPKLRYVVVCRDCEMKILHPKAKKKENGLGYMNYGPRIKVDDREL